MSRSKSQSREQPTYGSLLYKRGRNWKPLPAWTEFYTELGQYAAKHSTQDGRLVIAVAAPTRSFAAAFAALGVVRTQYCFQVVPSRDHFEYLCTLAQATPLLYRDGESLTRAFFDSVVTYDNQKFVKILKTGKRKGHEPGYVLLPRDRAHLVEHVIEDDTKLSQFIVGRELPINSEFISSYFGDAGILDNVTRPHLDCAIVGVLSKLRKEIAEHEFGHKCGAGVVDCFLNDIVMVKKFSRILGIYHTQIFRPTPTNKLPQDKGEAAVIFDGAIGFLNCRNNFKSSCWIVLLDKTDPNFDEAVLAVNQEFSRASTGVDLQELKETVPAGVEVMAFRVAQ